MHCRNGVLCQLTALGIKNAVKCVPIYVTISIFECIIIDVAVKYDNPRCRFTFK